MNLITSLTEQQAQAVTLLAATAAKVDGVMAFNEDALLALRSPAEAAYALLFAPANPKQLIGVGICDRHGNGQLLIDPAQRCNGYGRQIMAHFSNVSSWWSFGDLPAARAFAKSENLAITRELLCMSRNLTNELTAKPLPHPKITIRAFDPSDTKEFLAVNAAAFSHHREQGTLDHDAFMARTKELWFNPCDLLIADCDGEIVGFHWLKRHDGTTGEVYVLAVKPGWEGHQIGRYLLDNGIIHLAEHGISKVILFVDGQEERPVRLYSSAKFEIVRRDIAWTRQQEKHDE
ncbi:MAG: mycothiol synthase [Propionibacteriaceae bacterium]